MPNHKHFLVANWKMAMTTHQALDFMKMLSVQEITDSRTQVIIAPSFVTLPALHQWITQHSTPIALCAQNSAAMQSGAYTGEVSAVMLKETGCDYVIIGHSERRILFGEREPDLSTKVELAFQAGLTPIFCFGESRDIYESGKTNDFLRKQLAPYSAKLPFILAYEPIWSIGTGFIPTYDDLARTVGFIRSLFPDTALLYGGSVNGSNIDSLLQHTTMNGFLVGGASLKPDVFYSLYQAMNQR
ncbi:triose-phosphate isomerase [bacterium]|nr:triose-phosphate isomerase [bacterium]